MLKIALFVWEIPTIALFVSLGMSSMKHNVSQHALMENILIPVMSAKYALLNAFSVWQPRSVPNASIRDQVFLLRVITM